MIKRWIKQYKIWKHKRSIKELELQIMFFEIPFELALAKINWHEKQIKQLQNDTN